MTWEAKEPERAAPAPPPRPIHYLEARPVPRKGFRPTSAAIMRVGSKTACGLDLLGTTTSHEAARVTCEACRDIISPPAWCPRCRAPLRDSEEWHYISPSGPMVHRSCFKEGKRGR